jgi:predicted peptidase
MRLSGRIAALKTKGINSNLFSKKIAFKIIAFCLLMATAKAGIAQDYSAYEKHWLVQGGDSLPYRVLLPLHYDSSRQYPILFFLHGAGERGRDNEKQLVHGGRLFLNPQLRSKYPVIIIAPQCAETDYWSNVLRLNDANGKRTFHFLAKGKPTVYMQLLEQLVTYCINNYPVKKDQVYAGGLSMGGMGTFELVRRMPGRFAAAFAICGGADTATAKIIHNSAWWIFHGKQDNVVPPAFSENMAAALQRYHSDVKLTLYPGANHNSWDSAFAEPELLPWLLSKKRIRASGK